VQSCNPSDSRRRLSISNARVGWYLPHSTSKVEGNLIKRAEVRYYGGTDPKTGEADEGLAEQFDFKVISVDCASRTWPLQNTWLSL